MSCSKNDLLKSGKVCKYVRVPSRLLYFDVFLFSGQANARVIGARVTSLEVDVMDRSGSGGRAGGRHAVLLMGRLWLGRWRASPEHVESGKDVLVK